MKKIKRRTALLRKTVSAFTSAAVMMSLAAFVPMTSYSAEEVKYEFENGSSGGEMTEKPEVIEENLSNEKVIFVNVKIILLAVVSIAGIAILIIFVTTMIRNYQFGGRRSRNRRRKFFRRRSKWNSPHKDLHF